MQFIYGLSTLWMVTGVANISLLITCKHSSLQNSIIYFTANLFAMVRILRGNQWSSTL